MILEQVYVQIESGVITQGDNWNLREHDTRACRGAEREASSRLHGPESAPKT
jgi:hypothetical protein